MIGSVTVGSLAVTVLAMTADVALKGILGEYQTGIREPEREIALWANVAILEKMYTSSVRKAHVATVIEQRSQADQASIRDLTAALIEALKRDVQQGSVGISLRRLEAMQEQLRAITTA